MLLLINVVCSVVIWCLFIVIVFFIKYFCIKLLWFIRVFVKFLMIMLFFDVLLLICVYVIVLLCWIIKFLEWFMLIIFFIDLGNCDKDW